MKVLNLTILLILMGPTICVGGSDSLFNAKTDSALVVLSQHNLELDSQIQAIKSFEKAYEIRESLFSNQMNILTTIFSAIVAIAIFIIGYLIPKLNNAEHKKEISNLLKKFETIRDEIETSRKEAKKIEAIGNRNNSRLMFYSCQDSKNTVGQILWALRHCQDRWEYDETIKFDEISYYIQHVETTVKTLNEKHNLKPHIDEIGELTRFLKENFKDDGLVNRFDKIKEEFNIACWTSEKKGKKEE